MKEQMFSDQQLFNLVMEQAALRRAAMLNFDPSDPLSVYVENETLNYPIICDPLLLPSWRRLGQHMKILLINQAAIDLGGYAFSVNIRDELRDKWESDAVDPIDRINRIMRSSLAKQGFKDLAYMYVIEGKAKGGRSKTPLHIHGVLLNQNVLTPIKFKLAMENGLAGLGDRKSRKARAIHLVPAYDASQKPNAVDRGSWARYILKNVMKNDKRLSGSRIVISDEATRTAHEFWKLICQTPLSDAELVEAMALLRSVDGMDASNRRQ